MSQPLIATHRLRMQYPVDGLTHVAVKYCVLVPGGSPGMRQLELRDTTTAPFFDCAQGFIDTWGFLATGSPTMTVDLQEFTPTEWRFLEGYIAAPQSSGIGAFAHAQQTTMVYRDTNANKLRAQWEEAGLPYVGHSAGGTDLGTPVKNWVFAHTVLAPFSFPVTSQPPFFWEVSRSNLYASSVGGLAGVTFSANRKLRRRRGLA